MVVIFLEYVNHDFTYHIPGIYFEVYIYSNCSWLTDGDRQHPYRTIILFFTVKYVPGMVRSICVLIMLSNPFVSFWFLLGSLILGWRINSPSRWCDFWFSTMWKERHASARGYGEINARVIYCSVSKHYCSSLAIIGKREYSVAVIRTVRWRKRGWFGGCLFGIREYLASCTTYGSLTKTVVVRWLFLVFGIRYFRFWVKQGSRAGEMWWL